MEPLGLLARLWLAIVLPWRVLFDGAFATRVSKLPDGAEPAKLPEAEKKPARAEPVETDPTPALQLLAILQREGRLIDFLQEDVSSFSDAEIGAAARVVHDGCRRGLADYVELQPVRVESEGAAVELPPGFDASRTRVTGNVKGEPPFKGKLAHHGWQVQSIRLPKPTKGHDNRIVAPAEVEL